MSGSKNHNLVKRGNVWYFRFRTGKKVIRKSLSKSVIEARKLRDDLLKEMSEQGNNPSKVPENTLLFKEIVDKWYQVRSQHIKYSTMRDYQSTMNLHLLPYFGKRPIRDITYFDIEEFMGGLKCSSKRINNILVPMRSVFTLAYKQGIIQDNVMLKVDNLRIDDPNINPFSMDEVMKILENVHSHYRNCLTVLFFTGLRFGEMAALKWKNVFIERKTARICKTLVYGIEGTPKTKKSNRDIDLLPPVIEALTEQKQQRRNKSGYVFLDMHGNPLNTDHMRNVIWKPALKKAGIEYRPPIQTRHTFATLSISAGENIGWVQHMLGHGSLQMIYTKYYSWIPRGTRNDGSAIMKEYKSLNGDD